MKIPRRNSINWDQEWIWQWGREGYSSCDFGKADTKALSVEATSGKVKKSSVSEATWARVRVVGKSPFLHLNLMSASYRLCNIIGTGDYQFSEQGKEGWIGEKKPDHAGFLIVLWGIQFLFGKQWEATERL